MSREGTIKADATAMFQLYNYEPTMTDEQKEIESLKYRVSQLEMHMANLQRKDFEAKEEIKEQVKRSQRDMDQVEKLAGG